VACQGHRIATRAFNSRPQPWYKKGSNIAITKDYTMIPTLFQALKVIAEAVTTAVLEHLAKARKRNDQQ
jgi:hypothetical protein